MRIKVEKKLYLKMRMKDSVYMQPSGEKKKKKKFCRNKLSSVPMPNSKVESRCILVVQCIF